MDRRWLDRLLEDSGRIELRIKTPTGFKSRVFDDADALATAIRQNSDTTVYATLNRPASTVTAGSRVALRDRDIEIITRIVFDFDPRRPTGVPSTDAEVAAALQVRDDLIALLYGFGWGMPALGMSGNGAHAIYRTRLKATDDWRRLAARLYLGLRERLSESCREAGVHFDTSVRNPARIWRIYGTVNRKGAATPERPHRMAEVVLPAAGWQPVKAAVINRTADAVNPVVQERTPRPAQAPIRGSGDYTTLDVVGWFETHGHYRRTLGDGKHAVKCPWDHEHSMPSDGRDRGTVIWDRGESGWPTFHCSHAHCDGRRLVDVIALWGDADAYCSTAWRRDHG